MERKLKEYTVKVVVESAIGTLFGANKLPIEMMEAQMNELGQQGWEVAFIAIEKRRLLLWKREAAVITYSRSL